MERKLKATAIVLDNRLEEKQRNTNRTPDPKNDDPNPNSQQRDHPAGRTGPTENDSLQ